MSRPGLRGPERQPRPCRVCGAPSPVVRKQHPSGSSIMYYRLCGAHTGFYSHGARKPIPPCKLCGKPTSSRHVPKGHRLKYCDDCRIRRPALYKTLPTYQWYRIRSFQILGAECLRCGFDNQQALQFDHIRNDGASHRRDISNGTLAQWIARHPAEAVLKLQTLCANCNRIKEAMTPAKERVA